jgi:hypothetical protein
MTKVLSPFLPQAFIKFCTYFVAPPSNICYVFLGRASRLGLIRLKRREKLVAKKIPKGAVEKFLAELSNNPELLGKFIQHPEGAMKTAKIPAKLRGHIRDAVALDVLKRLVCVRAYHQH